MRELCKWNRKDGLTADRKVVRVGLPKTVANVGWDRVYFGVNPEIGHPVSHE